MISHFCQNKIRQETDRDQEKKKKKVIDLNITFTHTHTQAQEGYTDKYRDSNVSLIGKKKPQVMSKTK